MTVLKMLRGSSSQYALSIYITCTSYQSRETVHLNRSGPEQ